MPITDVPEPENVPRLPSADIQETAVSPQISEPSEKVRSSLFDNFDSETGERLPQIDLEIYFSPHHSVKDAEKLDARFKECDIYAPEMVGHTSASQRYMDLLSEGQVAPMKHDNAYNQSVENMLVGQHKKIILVDMDDKTLEKYESIALQIKNLNFEASSNFDYGNFDKACLLQQAAFAMSGDLENVREQCIKDRLQTSVNYVCKHDSSLRIKDRVRVLMSFGTAHRTLFHLLKKEHPEIKRTLGRDVVLLHSEEGDHRKKRHPDTPLSPELVARSFIEEKFMGHLSLDAFTDFHRLVAVMRYIAAQYSVDEIRELSSYSGRNSEYDFQQHFLRTITEKGFSLPKNDEDCDHILAGLGIVDFE